MQLRKITSLLVVALLVSASALASTAAAQAKPDISGKYEGMAKGAGIGEVPLTAEIKNDNGKISGKLDIPQGTATITSGTFADGKLSMKVDAGGTELTINGTFKDDKITGDWALADQTGTFELKKMGAAAAPATPPAASTPPAESKPAAGGDPITGDWDATVDAGGSSFPFVLKLKLEGDKVTGVSESSMGNAPLSKGSFVGDKLSFTLEIPQGAISFTGIVKDGKVKGNFEFPGQGSSTWEAKKK
ncbi:MAG TPA: hypothetical protein VKA70_00820 [Blastocatellia bacterium]|nr:hypothetical protein [Blastocatellia bacterium]